MNDTLKRFKELTGIKGSDVARKFSDILEDNVDPKYFLSEEQTAKLLKNLR